MQIWIKTLVTYCIERGYTTAEEAPWLCYALEKKIISFVIMIPFLLVGIHVSSLSSALAFFIGFYVLRTRISGLHSNKIWKCCVTSLLSEILFLGVLAKHLNKRILIYLTLFSGMVIYMFAPFKHPNMNFSDEEVFACAISAKIRLTLLFLILGSLVWMQCEQAATGLALGIVMAAVLLAIAYINKKGEF